MNDIKDLIGKTLQSVEVDKDGEEIIFTTTDGRKFRMFHMQDCCESVTVDDICGELKDIIGAEIVKAEEVTNENENPSGVPQKEYQESFTWTFYKIYTAKGNVTIRWYGESNGYYSESVEFVEIEK